MIRNGRLLIAAGKAVRFKDTLEQCELVWGTTEPFIVGKIEAGTSPLKRGGEILIFENC